MESKDLPKRAPDLQRLVEEVESLVPSPQQGLPDPVFGLLSRLSALVGADLLINDEEGRTLLTWRHDESYGPGWHVPAASYATKKRLNTGLKKWPGWSFEPGWRLILSPLLWRNF